MSSAVQHYDERYFSWQRSIGEFGGWANLTKFETFIQPHFNVIDFGCGGGYLLKNLVCTGKIGVEVNEVARRQAEQLGIKTYAMASEIEDDWSDIIISNHALEHCGHPLQELQALRPKVKKGGKIVCVIPCESIHYTYTPKDVNYHLYTWSPMCLGNLFTEAGFIVEESKPYIHKWPIGFRKIAAFGGRRLFEICCRVYGHLERSSFQVRIVAHKE